MGDIRRHDGQKGVKGAKGDGSGSKWDGVETVVRVENVVRAEDVVRVERQNGGKGRKEVDRWVKVGKGG